MKRLLIAMLLILSSWNHSTSAQLLLSRNNNSSTTSSATAGGVIVRTNLGSAGLQLICLLNGCRFAGNLDGNIGQVFLVMPDSGILPEVLASTLRLIPGILDAEVDQVLTIPTETANQVVLTTPPSELYDTAPVTYYGSVVWNGYANQLASQIVDVALAQNSFSVTGTGVVADIDTGVDPTHPALSPVLLPGYDFTRNQAGGSEMTDLNGATGSACSSCQAAFVNQHTAAMLDQHTAAMLDGAPYAAFGHGTMVMGVIHIVAPTVNLLPLKAFDSDGTGNLSDIIRAIYYAVQNHANVINMSFSLTADSTELADALAYATGQNVICVASAGNDGLDETVYPAAWQQSVIGVASTNDFDQRSSFSNYGDQVVWVAAPGENIISTYPFGSYAASSGTSFSAPFVSGAAALLVNLNGSSNQNQFETAVSNAQWIGPNMGNGRLDVYRSLAGH